MNDSNMQHPKVVVIGAGSLFFGRQSIWQMVHSPYLNRGTLALVDTDEERLSKMVRLAEMVAKENNVFLKVEGSTDRRQVLPGADFVVLSFAEQSVKYRGIDCQVSLKYGIRMCSGDTIGPGGIFRAMRELPVIMECVKDIEELCPDAWVINYINPSTVHGIALHRYAPKLKSFALCDSHHMPHKKADYAVRAGIIGDRSEFTEEIDRKFDFRVAGVNHFTWLLKAEFEGRNVMPVIAEAMRKAAGEENNGGDHGAKALHNDAITYELYDIFGYIPTCTAHTKEYVRYWQALGKTRDSIPPLSIWETEDRYQRHDEMWRQVDDFLTGNLPIADYMSTFGPDHATDIIENMVGNLGKRFFINTLNRGAVTNMSDDSFLELLCDVCMEGAKPVHVGEMPRGIRGMQELVLDTHELTAEAVVEQSYEKLKRAMLTDPLVNSISDADQIIKELLVLEREMIPDAWYED
ncbi:glycoside hydrolase family 4 [Paenibacillus lautus]|uniref:Glycoside hydrolase family 4 n=1 Tax=Paenibacillus lautus TaxID=1401 RepID=A0A385THJ9_PAELA|nr:glycoside hydrolase family 4 [Paenibacillus lautus]AYB43139.1 glycoside hydrolase family 4 [Paenibacillus lautus]